ncbi:MAG: biotin--[acetyl-CoA-carboxylase] ligase [Eubacteriales bacterium]|nr:biotin--[acetyl-CoA-carboxylase] ligase [Eubacteriales bacterium]
MVRDDVLRALEQHRGQLVSGGTLAKELGVSRTAVWKAITTLREMGFPIESSAGEGYRLAESSDALSEAGIVMELNTERLARNLCVLSTVDSTNTYLKERAATLPDGYAVVADCQTAGRGRRGRSFLSPSGTGVYISLLLHPSLPLERINMITVGAAVALSEAIAETAGFTPDIKWVNDILKNGKKLCGILTEASVEAETGQLSYAIVGVGINVRMPETGLPEEIRDIAGCLEDFSPYPVRRNALTASFFNHMESCYQLIVSGNTEALIDRYRSFIHFLGEPITVIQNGEKQPATAVAIDSSGHLVIEQDGRRSTMLAGEISIRLPEQSQ